MLNIAQKEKLRKIDSYLYETIVQMERAINSMAKQLGTDPVGIFPQTPQIAAINITAANGIANVQIVDNSFINNPSSTRTVDYYVEAATDSGFSNIIHHEAMGPARNKNLFLGNQTLFFRAYSQLQGSRASLPVNFGGPIPTGVAIGGVAAPTQQSYQGSGSSSTGGRGFGDPPIFVL